MTGAQSGKALFYAVWPTAWGPMGAAAGTGGLRRVILPHYQTDQIAELLAWEFPEAACDEGPFAELIGLSRDYFNGKVVEFGAVGCEVLSRGTFGAKVLGACRTIPYGRTRSYGSLAEQLRRPEAARATAAALSRNPVPLVIPCHRVIYADGRTGGFSAPGGPGSEALKKRLLDLEKTHLAGIEE